MVDMRMMTACRLDSQLVKQSLVKDLYERLVQRDGISKESLSLNAIMFISQYIVRGNQHLGMSWIKFYKARQLYRFLTKINFSYLCFGPLGPTEVLVANVAIAVAEADVDIHI